MNKLTVKGIVGKAIVLMSFIVAVCAFSLSTRVTAAQFENDLTATHIKPKQEVSVSETYSPLRLGYCQSELYYEFDQQFYYLVKGMEEYGLIPEVTEAGGFDETTSSRKLWQYLSVQEQRDWKVQFVPEAYISMDSFPEVGDKENQAKTIHSVIKQQDVNLIITMGTKAGLAAREFAYETAFMNFMSADPVGAGIVMDAGTSKIPGAWAMVDPQSFTRSFSVMYDIFQPKTVGIIYADNEKAYIYSGARELDQFCGEKQVTVRWEYVDDTFEDVDYETYRNNLLEANERLAGQVDVFIMTTSLLKPEDYAVILEPFCEAQVPVYSINSVVDVEYGALMAVEAADYRNIGRFGADTMKSLLGGAKLEDTNQIYQTAPFLVLNYTTAKRIGYRPDFKMLCSTSKIYH